MKADSLYQKLSYAREFLGKIGKPQPHFGDSSRGELRSVEMVVTIHHQDRPSATNYWKNEDFCLALSRVVKQNFSELAEKAIGLMEQDAKSALVEEEAYLIERLEKVRTIKEGGKL